MNRAFCMPRSDCWTWANAWWTTSKWISNGVNFIANPTFEKRIGQLDKCWVTIRGRVLMRVVIKAMMRCTCVPQTAFGTGDNSCEANLNANSMAQGSTVTLRFKARWLHGWPEVLLRLNGGWLDMQPGRLKFPIISDRPECRTASWSPTAGPAIYLVSHSPSVPAAGRSVVVSAKVHDPDGVQSLILHYRIDPSPNYVAVTMNETQGPAVMQWRRTAFLAQRSPGQTANTIVAFYLTATDAHGAVTRFPALLNNNAPVPECVVMFGDTIATGSFTTYHSWITQTNVNRWADLSDLSNETCDFTFAK